jgi:superfamily I DNA/RNA helicase
LLPDDFKAAILKEAESFQVSTEGIPVQEPEVDKSKPVIKLTSFEGSKGLSAQHVFVVGVHENELPKKASDIKDIEICKFLVSLTRTRKQCHLLTTYRFSGAPKRPSIFLNWVPSAVKKVQKINKAFWENLSDA